MFLVVVKAVVSSAATGSAIVSMMMDDVGIDEIKQKVPFQLKWEIPLSV